MIPIIFQRLIFLSVLFVGSIMASEVEPIKNPNPSPSPQPVERKGKIDRRGSFNASQLTKQKKQNSMHELVSEQKISV